MHQCVAVLRQAGCQVTFEAGGKIVRVVFHDGTVREYSTSFFTLLTAKVLLEESERIGAEN